MNLRKINLRRFEDSGAGASGGAGGSGTGGQGGAGASGGNGGVTYSYEQAEQIANERASRAQNAALKSFFEQQGMTQEQVTAALSDYRAKQAANSPSARNAQLERELAEANGKIQGIERKETLSKIGVAPEFSDFVAHEVAKNVTDKKDFETAAKEYIKSHPVYAKAAGYRVNTGASGSNSGGSQGDVNGAMNSFIRSAAGYR